ncbi:hypothetical protein ACOME3_005791 [Neoechinorhynchus agilis]
MLGAFRTRLRELRSLRRVVSNFRQIADRRDYGVPMVPRSLRNGRDGDTAILTVSSEATGIALSQALDCLVETVANRVQASVEYTDISAAVLLVSLLMHQGMEYSDDMEKHRGLFNSTEFDDENRHEHSSILKTEDGSTAFSESNGTSEQQQHRLESTNEHTNQNSDQLAIGATDQESSDVQPFVNNRTCQANSVCVAFSSQSLKDDRLNEQEVNALEGRDANEAAKHVIPHGSDELDPHDEGGVVDRSEPGDSQMELRKNDFEERIHSDHEIDFCSIKDVNAIRDIGDNEEDSPLLSEESGLRNEKSEEGALPLIVAVDQNQEANLCPDSCEQCRQSDRVEHQSLASSTDGKLDLNLSDRSEEITVGQEECGNDDVQMALKNEIVDDISNSEPYGIIKTSDLIEKESILCSPEIHKVQSNEENKAENIETVNPFTNTTSHKIMIGVALVIGITGFIYGIMVRRGIY